MNIQTILLPECLITYFTGIMTLNIMHVLMSYKTYLLTDVLLHTSRSMLTTMYVLMCYHTALLTQCLITNFTGILALTARYVCAYALSDYSSLYALLHTSQT